MKNNFHGNNNSEIVVNICEKNFYSMNYNKNFLRCTFPFSQVLRVLNQTSILPIRKILLYSSHMKCIVLSF